MADPNIENKKNQVVTMDTLLKHERMTLRSFNDYVQSSTQTAIKTAEAKRQAAEDERANRRNLNRMLTLIGALVIGIVVSYVLTHGYLGNLGKALGPYAFCITILLDSSLAVYSLIRHY